MKGPGVVKKAQDTAGDNRDARVKVLAAQITETAQSQTDLSNKQSALAQAQPGLPQPTPAGKKDDPADENKDTPTPKPGGNSNNQDDDKKDKKGNTAKEWAKLGGEGGAMRGADLAARIGGKVHDIITGKGFNSGAGAKTGADAGKSSDKGASNQPGGGESQQMSTQDMAKMSPEKLSANLHSMSDDAFTKLESRVGNEGQEAEQGHQATDSQYDKAGLKYDATNAEAVTTDTAKYADGNSDGKEDGRSMGRDGDAPAPAPDDDDSPSSSMSNSR